MIYWLAQACREQRDRHELKQSAVAGALNMNQSSIHRFEKGSWPHHPDEIVAAYARVTQVDVRDIWQRAIDLWRQHGETPSLPAT